MAAPAQSSALGENTPVRLGLALLVGGGVFGLFAYIRTEVHDIRDDLMRTVAAGQKETREAIKESDRRMDVLISQIATVSSDVRVNTGSIRGMDSTLTEHKQDVRRLESAVEKLAAQLEELPETEVGC